MTTTDLQRNKPLKIYTKTGDTGQTSLFGGKRVRKDSARIEAYGTVDELNSFIGLTLTAELDAKLQTLLRSVQNDLFVLGSDLATPLEQDKTKAPRITEEHVRRLEKEIDIMQEQLAPLRTFVLPGGSEAAARIHICRTVCRRAERLTVETATRESINPENIKYLNRLSDFLFVLARRANLSANIPDIPWRP